MLNCDGTRVRVFGKSIARRCEQPFGRRPREGKTQERGCCSCFPFAWPPPAGHLVHEPRVGARCENEVHWRGSRSMFAHT